MEVKKLSEIPLDKCIYMSIGTHANEPINEIMDRKEKEIEDCDFGLWAYSSPIAEKIDSFCENEDAIYVVMTDTGKPTKGEVVEAKINDEDNMLIKSDYERREYFNGFELLEKKQESSKRRTCKIVYVAKLKYPFSVYIK